MKGVQNSGRGNCAKVNTRFLESMALVKSYRGSGLGERACKLEAM